jgi:hypothetical protein
MLHSWLVKYLILLNLHHTTETTGQHRYFLHPLHRETAAKLLDGQGEEAKSKAQRGFITHMMGLLEKLSVSFIPEGVSIVQDGEFEVCLGGIICLLS